MMTAADPGLRRRAVTAASLTGHDSTLPWLRRFLEEKEHRELAPLAALALGLIHTPAASALLLERLSLLTNRSQKKHLRPMLAILGSLSICTTRGHAFNTLESLKESRFTEGELEAMALWYVAHLDPEGASKLVLRAGEKDLPSFRPYILPALACLQEKEEAGRLLVRTALSPARTLEERFLALAGLGRMDFRLTRPLFPRLARRIEGEPAHLLTLARARGGDRDHDFLASLYRDLVKSSSPARRAACALALGRVASPAAGKVLVERLQVEKEPRVLGAVLAALGAMDESRAVPAARQLFLATKEGELVRMAAMCLADLAPGTPLPKEVWAGLAGKDPNRLATLRLRWCGLFGGGDTLARLAEVLADPEAGEGVLIEALRALRVVGSPTRPAPAAEILLVGPMPKRLPPLAELRKILWGV